MGAQGDTKTRQAEAKMGWHGMLVWHVWPGNFPTKHACMCSQTKRGIRDSGG